jgi:type II secretory pathway component PulF
MIKKMIVEFELQLPWITRMFFWWRETGIWVLVIGALVLLGLAVIYRLLGGRRRWRRLVSTVPLFGALWHWTSVAEWSGLLSVLLRHQVPLPDALRWAGRGTRDAHVGHLSRRMADGVARGRSLSQMMYATQELPTAIVPLVEWGEKTGTLPDAFSVGQEMFEKRAKTRAMMLQAVIPPVLFLGVGCMILFVVLGLFAPLFILINSLS